MRYCLLVVGLFLSGFSLAQEEQAPPKATFVEGTHYLKLLDPVTPIVAEDKVEITEIFRFGCPACFQFEAKYKTWAKTKADYITFVKTPVVWDEVTKAQAYAYYTAEHLGVGAQMSTKIFADIHENAKTRSEAKNVMKKKADVVSALVSFGVDEEKADKVYSSFGIKSVVNRADGRARAFAVGGTPEIFVDGRYRITVSTTGSFEKMLEVASYVAELVAKEKGLL